MKINLYIIPFILSLFSYLFTISVPLFGWLYPEEILLSEITQSRGLLGCIEFYYMNTTVHRIGNIVGGCLMACNANLFSSEFFGWITNRFIIYTFLPLATASILMSRLKINLIKSLIVSFVINRNNENNILPFVRQDIKKGEISKLKLIYFSKKKYRCFLV